MDLRSTGLESMRVGTAAREAVERATQREQLLTPAGMEIPYDPYSEGRPTTEERRSFYGREAILAKIRERLERPGFALAVIEGGYRSGKTSLLETTGARMVKDGIVGTAIVYDLAPDCSSNSEQVVAGIEDTIGGEEAGIEGEAVSAPVRKERPATTLVMLDGVEAYGSLHPEWLTEILDALKAKGYKVAMAVTGDLHGTSAAELPREVKDKLLEMAGDDGVIVNELLTDEEARELLEQSKRQSKGPLFTEVMTEYLVAEAGGNPFLASLLASNAFDLLRFRGVEPNGLVQKLEEAVETELWRFGQVVDVIVSAGFNPLTWEWRGEGTPPDVGVYQNMIPRPTSTIFLRWLTGYLDEKNKKDKENQAIG